MYLCFSYLEFIARWDICRTKGQPPTDSSAGREGRAALLKHHLLCPTKDYCHMQKGRWKEIALRRSGCSWKSIHVMQTTHPFQPSIHGMLLLLFCSQNIFVNEPQSMQSIRRRRSATWRPHLPGITRSEMYFSNWVRTFASIVGCPWVPLSTSKRWVWLLSRQ